MLVGKSDVNIYELEKRSGNIDSFLAYSDSLIPEEFRHIEAIRDNQRYVSCLILRKSMNVSWDVKKELIDQVMKNISIVGYTNILIETDMLYRFIHIKKMQNYRTWRGNNEFSKRNRNGVQPTNLVMQ